MPDHIPQLPDEVIRASSERRLVVFLGAGISCAVGMPSWNKVKDELIDKVRLSSTDSPSVKDGYRSSEIYNCFGLIRKKDESIYKDVLLRSLMSSQADLNQFRFLIEAIKTLNPVSIVTTNVDDLLFDCGEFKRDQFRFKQECAPQDLSTAKIFCIHGWQDSSVFSCWDKETLYSRPDFKSFLFNLFGSYCVLFIGFSFVDKAALEHARLNEEFIKKNPAFVQHFTLLPSTHNVPSPQELELFGIRVLNYENSDDSHKNFINTIYSWQQKMQPPSTATTGDLSRSVI